MLHRRIRGIMYTRCWITLCLIRLTSTPLPQIGSVSCIRYLSLNHLLLRSDYSNLLDWQYQPLPRDCSTCPRSSVRQFVPIRFLGRFGTKIRKTESKIFVPKGQILFWGGEWHGMAWGLVSNPRYIGFKCQKLTRDDALSNLFLLDLFPIPLTQQPPPLVVHPSVPLPLPSLHFAVLEP